jgi:hypothetical protein
MRGNDSDDAYMSAEEEKKDMKLPFGRGFNAKLPALPKLMRSVDVEIFFELCEAVLTEWGRPDVLSLMATKLKVIENMSEIPHVHNAAMSSVRLSWEDFKVSLIRTFANPAAVARDFEARFSALKYGKPGFMADVRSLYSGTRFVSDEEFVRRLLLLVPARVGEKLIERLERTQPSAGVAYWRHLPVFVILDALEETMLLMSDVELFRPTQDRVRRVGNGAAREKAGEERNKFWLDDWVKSHVVVYVYYPSGAVDPALLSKAKEHKQLQNRQKRTPYYLLAFDSEAAASSTLKALPSSSYRKFNSSNH